MGASYKQVRMLQGERVRMQFDDGREVVATLLCATKDVDGSRHLIYDKVESACGIDTGVSQRSGCVYAPAKTLVSIESADAPNVARTFHGWDYVDLRHCA
jgi:hypothetical protein